MTDMIGIDAIRPPKYVLFFAISDTRTIIPDDIKSLMKV